MKDNKILWLGLCYFGIDFLKGFLGSFGIAAQVTTFLVGICLFIAAFFSKKNKAFLTALLVGVWGLISLNSLAGIIIFILVTHYETSAN